MSDKIDENNIFPWLTEAIEAYEAAPDKVEHLFIWCYCEGATNAMKALRGEADD